MINIAIPTTEVISLITASDQYLISVCISTSRVCFSGVQLSHAITFQHSLLHDEAKRGIEIQTMQGRRARIPAILQGGLSSNMMHNSYAQSSRIGLVR